MPQMWGSHGKANRKKGRKCGAGILWLFPFPTMPGHYQYCIIRLTVFKKTVNFLHTHISIASRHILFTVRANKGDNKTKRKIERTGVGKSRRERKEEKEKPSMALTSRPKGDKISKQQGAGEVSQYIQHKREAGRCKAPWTWPKGAREQWGGNAPPVSRRYRGRVFSRRAGGNSGGTTDKRKCGARDCEGAWTGARARAGPQGGP